MNPDWTFPTQPDDLEPYVYQDTIDPRLLEEPDAMDAMLWDGPPVPSIDPCLDSEDVMGLWTDSNMDFGCVCDLPALYCEQHGVYGDFSVDTDLLLPSLGPGQTMTHPDDVLEPSELASGRLELTEDNLADQSLFQSSFEMGHANPSMPTNDQSTSLCTANDSPIPINPPGKRRLRRSKISSKNRRILKAQYLIHPYPTDNVFSELHKRTGLDEKCIKTWFMNTRHRTAHGHAPVTPSPQESRERSLSETPSETPSQASTSLSAENLRELDRLSPARNTTSLERYIDSLPTEEVIPPTEIDSLSDICSTPLEKEYRELQTEVDHTMKKYMEKMSEFAASRCKLTNARQAEFDLKQSHVSLSQGELETRMLRAHQPEVGVAGSVSNSDSSFDSVESAGSWVSQNSVDSRGPRRGRRSWVQVPNQSTATGSRPKVDRKASATNKLPKRSPWYCTWPSCTKSFRFRSEWNRHEAAVHHWPYHWICNQGEQISTTHKDAASRIFYREDGFLVHTKDLHPGANVTKDSVSTFKQDNPEFNPESLRCGFCFQVLCNWEERQDHVAAHLKNGLPKSKWIPFGRSRFA